MSSSSNSNHSDQASDSSFLEEVIAEYIRACETGEPPDREKLLAKHPDIADELREFFANRDQMDQVARPMRDLVARVLNVRCPHCHNPIELLDEAPLRDINCPACGSSFSLVGNKSQGHYPNGSKTIGHFELLDRVGIGAFGSVWKARDTKLDRTVAIKIPRRGQLDESDAEMFLRDARATAQLKHPNIVGVHEVGKQNGTIYIVSDFIQGATLKEWMVAKPPTPRDVAELCIKISKALHHAHESGVIHRDLKPGNIMMDADGEPHIVDFGLAKREAGEITMTAEGQILGTPAYMSPEQARGEGHTVDRRADVYSMGVILFELLTGELPFRGDKEMLIVQIRNDDPPEPRKLNTSVPRDLQTICLKCLHKEPRCRYATAEGLSQDLSLFREQKPIHARPITRTSRVWRWCKRNRTVASLSASFLLVLLLIAVVSPIVAVHQTNIANQNKKLAGELEKALMSQRRATERADSEARLARLGGYNAQLARAQEQWRYDPALAAELLDNEQMCPGRLRDFTWHYLRRLCRSVTLKMDYRNFWSVKSAAFSPSGELIATIRNNRIVLWDTNTGQETAVLSEDAKDEQCLAFSPDGKTIASAGSSGGVSLWDVDTGQRRKLLSGHNAGIRALAYSANGAKIASASTDKTVRIWDTKTDEAIGSYTLDAIAIAFSPNTDTLGAACNHGTIKLLNLATHEVREFVELDWTKPHRYDRMNSLQFSPDSKSLAAFGSIFDLETAEEKAKHVGRVSPDFACVAIPSLRENNVTLLDAQTAETWGALNGYLGGVMYVVFSPDSKRLAAIGEYGSKLWRVDRHPEFVTFAQPGRSVGAVLFSPDGDTIAYRHSQRLILSKTTSKEKNISVEASSAMFAPDGNLLVVRPKNDVVELLDANDGSTLTSFETPSHTVSAISADRRWIARKGHKALTIWDFAKPQQVAELEGNLMAFTPDSQYLAVSDFTDEQFGEAVILWNTNTWEKHAVLKGHAEFVWSIAFSPDGRFVAAGTSTDLGLYKQFYSVCIWDLKSGRLLRTMGRTSYDDLYSEALSFSPDGKTLAVSLGNDIKLWDPETGQERGTLTGHTAPINSLAFAPDGRTLVSGSADGTVRLWPTEVWPSGR